MELTFIILVAMCFVTPTTTAPSLPSNSSGLLLSLSRTLASDTEILLKLLVVPSVSNATKQMKQLYPFLTSSNYFQEPPITLGLDLNKDCNNQQAKDKLGILHSQMAVFKEPLYFAFFYENIQGPLHSRLASALETTSWFVNDTVSFIRRKMVQKGFSVPRHPTIPEAKLDERTRLYLNILVQNNLVTLVITDDVVKTYRNYVVLYMLHDIMNDLDPCL